MTSIRHYRQFKLDCRGFVDVPFPEFRERLLPLRAHRSEWKAADEEYVRALADRGAGAAIQRLCGTKHPTVAKLLGGELLKPAPMSREELDEHMSALIRKCKGAGWLPEDFARFARRLDSGAEPEELQARDRAVAAARSAEMRFAGSAAAGPGGAEDARDREPAAPRDLFAEMYKSASAPFQAAVRERLQKA